MKIKYFLIIFIAMPFIMVSQNYKLELRSSIDYVKTYLIEESLISSSIKLAPFQNRIGGRIGLNINRHIVKFLSVDGEISYALSGVRYPKTVANPRPSDGKIINVHQICFSLSPTFNLNKNWSSGIGILKTFNIASDFDGFKSNNIAYMINVKYQKNRWGVGIRYTHFWDEYLSVEFPKTKQYWETYGLFFSYQISK